MQSAAKLSRPQALHSAQSARAARPLAGTAYRARVITQAATKNVIEPGDTVLVAGAGGGVGQLVVAKLLDRGFKVKALVRSPNSNVLNSYGPNITVQAADLRQDGAADPVLEGVSAVVCTLGTTAFPSKRWDGNNGPRPTDWVATSNLINAAKKRKDVKRFVYVTSAGVERQKTFPFAILNLFGVLRYKRDSEVLLEGSGIPYTIIRPNRLTDGPYTSYDLNTLLKATSGSRQDVQLALTDRLLGEASRIAVAEAVVQSLVIPDTQGKAFAIGSTEGAGPGEDTGKWQALFATAQP